MDDAEAQAEAARWGEELVGAMGAGRFRLELEEGRWRHVRALGRERYQARFRLWEALGWAEVELPREGSPRVQLSAGEPLELAAGALAPELVERALGAALREAEQLEARPLRARQVRAAPGRRGCAAVSVLLERHPPDGRLVIDLDPGAGGRVGWLCLPLLRGSTRSAALSRPSALRRARAALDLPPGARLTSARLIRSRAGRTWRLRWEVEGAASAGALVASLNARTGRVAVFLSTVGPRQRVLPAAAARETAERELRRAVVRRLGPGARLGGVVPGAVGADGELRAAWLAAVLGPDGAVFRAVLDRGRVSLRRSG